MTAILSRGVGGGGGGGGGLTHLHLGKMAVISN